ncbi:hypothetical protein FQN57_004657 [Myotisia sp. PD_48]|nr:hypothetical protein FQN57_004657 [Myotisia sp. PD_48]
MAVSTRHDAPLIEGFEKHRDMSDVVNLWHRVLPQYAIPAETLQFVLTRPNGCHFISRRENKLIGFIATYTNDDRPTAFISAILVEPTSQGKGMGTALIGHVRNHLRKTNSTTSVTIGSSFPRFWPGVPLDISQQSQDFFRHRGFCPISGPTARDYTADLRTYEADPSVLSRAAEAGITFAPWRKEQYAECMRKQHELFGQDDVWTGAYEQLAQMDKHSQVMVAVDTRTGKQVGWSLMQELGIGMTRQLALQPLLGKKSGQIGCVAVDPEARNKGIGLALITHAALDLKRRGLEHVFIDWTRHVNWYERAGFKVWREYRTMVLKEVSNTL